MDVLEQTTVVGLANVSILVNTRGVRQTTNVRSTADESSGTNGTVGTLVSQ